MLLTMPPITPYCPSRADRLAAIPHVVHEYANLISAAHHSLYGQAPWRTHCDDAFLLGCRKMEHFLIRKTRTVFRGEELDDVLALDYLPNNLDITWSVPIWTNQWRYSMNKQLAHIA